VDKPEKLTVIRLTHEGIAVKSMDVPDVDATAVPDTIGVAAFAAATVAAMNNASPTAPEPSAVRAAEAEVCPVPPLAIATVPVTLPAVVAVPAFPLMLPAIVLEKVLTPAIV
jgi:hypothetical protein